MPKQFLSAKPAWHQFDVIFDAGAEVAEANYIVSRQENLRLLRLEAPGMPGAWIGVIVPARKVSAQKTVRYPAHTDSSLVTVAPKSTAAGLEVRNSLLVMREAASLVGAVAGEGSTDWRMV